MKKDNKRKRYETGTSRTAYSSPEWEGVKRVARIVGEEAYDPAMALVDEAELIEQTLPFHVRLSGPLYSLLGSSIARSLPFPKKKMSTRKNVTNSLVTRSAMSVKGKTKVKREKKVKLSDYFVKGVKQVMAGTQSTGTYCTLKSGMIGSLVAPSAQFINAADLGGSFPFVYSPAQFLPSGSRTLWSGLATWGAATNTTAIAQTGMNYFTPAKILDAASVLFNQKALADPYVQTNNLSTIQENGNGAPFTASVGSLKIHVISSAVTFELKNLSNRVINVDVWECTPTLKFQKTPPLLNLQGCYSSFTDGVGVGLDFNCTYAHGIPGGTLSVDANGIFEQGMDPLVVGKKFLGFPFTWKKRTMVLAPEETCVHQIIGPSGIMDFSKLTNQTASGTTELNYNSLVKGWSVGCIFSVCGDQVIDPASTNWTGLKAAYYDGTNVRMGQPIAVEVKEYYKLSVPEVAGFQNSLGFAAGTRQQLNLRKPKFVFWNQIGANGTKTNIQTSNEVNPIAEDLVMQEG